MQKELIFVMKLMNGGGAERVISLLVNSAVARGFKVKLIITHQSKKDAILRDVDTGIDVISLPDEIESYDYPEIAQKVVMLSSRFLGKIGKIFSPKLADKALVIKYLARNFKGISWLKSYFKKHKSTTVIAFLYDSIFYTLLSRSKNNKLIISERGDPCQSLGTKTTMSFIRNEFQKADRFVFQSPDVQKWYEENTSVRGTVIFNPIKADLPEPFVGERKKSIVNFCRINPQKNIPLLLDAFEKFSERFPEYELHIFGDTASLSDEEYYNRAIEKKNLLESRDKIHFYPARKDIHNVIRDYSMFVSSSDFEGMSNSMLEAMALGLPCVCTDCPAGGARAVIKDGENGLLVPVNDAEALAEAMCAVVSVDGLAEKLSRNSVKVREEQSLEKIIDKWMEIING